MNMKKLPFGQMKLAFVIPLVAVSLTSYLPQVGAYTMYNVLLAPLSKGGTRNERGTALRVQLAESLSNPVNSKRIHFVQQPSLPDNGAPTGRRRGGTSRDGCPALNTPITALVPGEETSGEVEAGNSTKTNSKSFLAKTVTEYPTFWVYLPELPTTLRAGEFVLQDNQGNDVYRTSLTLPGKSGFISIGLPSNPQYSLKGDNHYHWYFKVYCGAPQKTSEYFYVDAWVQRVALTPDLENQLKTVKPGKYIAYADNDIWYDAVTNLADLRRTDLQNPTLNEDWAELLKAVGLQNLAQAPIVQHYSLEQ
jgi:hypothetical protein